MYLYDYTGEKISTNNLFGTVNIAAHDSTADDKLRADYICTGTNDEQIIQAAIDSFGDKSGIVQLANGIYNIDAFTEHDGYYYGLYLPMKKREIIIRGVSHNHKSDNTSFSATDNAAVINVTETAYNSLSDTNESYVIGSNRTYTFPYKVLGVENLSITIPSNEKPIIGIDGAYCSCMHVEGCFFKSNASYSDDTNVNSKNVAIRGCGQGNIGYNYYFNHIKIIGWGTGFQITGEHLQAIDCIAQRTAYGFVFGTCDDVPYPRGSSTGLHPNTLINCGAEYNSKGAIYFGTGQANAISIIDFNMETGISSGSTWGSEFIISANDNSPFRGDISYAVLNNSNWKHVQKNAWDTNAHASKFKTVDLLAPIGGTTSNRPTDPVYLSQYFDTTLDKLIVWNGTAWV